MIVASRQSIHRYAWLSMAAAVATMAVKAAAYLKTASVGILADALESMVNLAAGILALVVLRVAAQPPDAEHRYGHEKAEYFSSGAEGTLILLAALTVVLKAGQRLVYPRPVVELGLGLSLLAGGAAINFATALVLLRAGRRLRSITLRANAHHLFTDVWTSGAVFAGLAAVALTGRQVLDPLIALAFGAYIAWTGLRLIRASVGGLMDRALPEEEVGAVAEILEGYAPQGVRYHALRTRQAGARSFVSLHIQVPGRWSVQRGHDVLEAIEGEIRARFPEAAVFTHLEPLEDPRSWSDVSLERGEED